MDRRIPHNTDLPHVILVVAASIFLILSMASCNSSNSDDTMMDDVEIATATKEPSPTKAVTTTHTPQPIPSAMATTKPTDTALPSATPTVAPTLTSTSLPTDTSTPVPATATATLAPTREPTKVPTETSTESPTEQPVAAVSEVQIISIFYDGVVSRSEPDEYCEIANLGGTDQSLNGWHLNAGNPGQDYWFGDYTLEAGQHCRVYTNENHAEWGTLSFGCGTAIWKNSGDCGYLYDASGRLVSSWCY